MQLSHPSAHPSAVLFSVGFLFSADACELKEGPPQPAWIAHGVRGDFSHYRL